MLKKLNRFLYADPPLYTGQATHEVIEGQEFRIMLQLTGNPLPLVDTVTWTFNGQPLSIGGGINFGLDFIEFSSINRTNEGNYTVTSSNLAGNASFALSISVFCKLTECLFAEKIK